MHKGIPSGCLVERMRAPIDQALTVGDSDRYTKTKQKERGADRVTPDTVCSLTLHPAGGTGGHAPDIRVRLKLDALPRSPVSSEGLQN